MKKSTREWIMVCELCDMVDELDMSDNARDFILGLRENLDEFMPFTEQQSIDQLDYLYQLHDRYKENWA